MSLRTPWPFARFPPLLATGLRLLALAGLLLAATGNAQAAPAPARPTEAVREFDLAAGDIFAALKQFTSQSGEQLIYRVDSLEGVKTAAVRGRFTPREALGRMLDRTNLVVTRDERTGTLAIRPGAESRDPTSPPSASAVKKKSPTP